MYMDNISFHVYLTDTKPWTVKDVIRLLKKMKRQLPRVDNKGCLYTAKKIDWNCVAFDCFTAEDCKKEFEILLNSIKLVKLVFNSFSVAVLFHSLVIEYSLSRRKY